MATHLRHGRRLGTVMTLALCTALGLSACSSAGGGQSSDNSSGETQTIFVFGYFPREFNTVTQQWSKGFDQAAEELGDGYDVELKYESSVNVDPGTYLNFIRTSMVQEPDGIIVIPNNSSAMTQGLTQLQSEYPDVKILVMDQPVPDFEPVSFVGTDNEQAGAQAAEWLLEQHDAGQLESNEVAIFRSPPGGSSGDARLQGFLDVIEGSDLEVVQIVQPADIQPATSAAAMRDVLVAHPDLGAVFSVSDTFGLGVAKAIADTDSPVKSISIDASAEAVQMIIDGAGMHANVAQHLFDMGYTSLVTLSNALEGKSVEPVIDTGTTLVTPENAEEFLASLE